MKMLISSLAALGLVSPTVPSSFALDEGPLNAGEIDPWRVFPAADVLAYSSDGSLLAIASQAEVHLWDVLNDTLGKRIATMPDGYEVTSLSFSSNGSFLALASRLWGEEDGYSAHSVRVELWDLDADTLRSAFNEFDSTSPLAVAFSPGAGSLLAIAESSGIRLWDVSADSLRAVLEPSTGLSSLDDGRLSRFLNSKTLCFSSDGSLLAATGYGDVSIWDVSAGKLVRNLDVRAITVAFSFDSRTLIADNGTLWDVESGQLMDDVLSRTPNLLGFVASSPVNSTFATGGSNGTILWSIDGRWKLFLESLFPSDLLHVKQVAFSPDGRFLASSTARGVGIWDLTSYPPFDKSQGEATLQDASGNPVSGVELMFGRHKSARRPFCPWRAVTDEDGRVPLHVPRHGYYFVQTFDLTPDPEPFPVPTEWRTIPLSSDRRFDLSLRLSSLQTPERGPPSWDTSWGLPGVPPRRIEVDVRILNPFNLPSLPLRWLLQFSQSVSGRSPYYVWADYVWTDSSATTFTIVTEEGRGGLFQAQAHHHTLDSPYSWHSIPFNSGRRHSLDLVLGGTARVVAVEPLEAAKPSTGPLISTRLGPGVPNPFNGSTLISYSLVDPGPVRLEVYDVLGQLVRRLVDTDQLPGDYHVSWDGHGEFHPVASGVYLVRLIHLGRVHSRRLLLLK